MPSLGGRSVNINFLSPSWERVDASSNIFPVNQFHLYQPSVASAPRKALLLSEQCKSSGHGSFLHLSIPQYSNLSIRLLLGWLLKLNITVNCIDANVSATEKKLLCILVRCKANVGHFIHTFGAYMTDMKQLRDVELSSVDLVCLGCSLKLQWSMKGELVFLLSSQKRESTFTKVALAMLPERLYLGPHFFFPPAAQQSSHKS